MLVLGKRGFSTEAIPHDLRVMWDQIMSVGQQKCRYAVT